jgi:MoaA/NifB/PqqE/SkfB family radical SAM enzyme
MPVDMAIEAWQGLQRLAGRQARVHITGGEPFLVFERMAEIVRRAHQEGLTPIDSIETNGGWAVNDPQIRERIGFLADHGMDRLKISWDPFHAEYVDIECIRRLVETASHIIGRNRVLVRWDEYLNDPLDMRRLTLEQRNQEFQRSVAKFPIRFTGRSAGQLADLFSNQSFESLAGQRCLETFLSAKGVHIDPYGNVFSGLCSGIILGNITTRGLDEIWKNLDPCQMDLVGQLCSRGPEGLVPEARKAGFVTGPRYAGKCHLCTRIRQFFFDNRRHLSIIGPEDCYERIR